MTLEHPIPRGIVGAFTGITEDLPTGSENVSDDGLELAYDMGTLRAGKMRDFSPNAFDGTITGTTDIAGKYDRARKFPGGSDSIDIPFDAGMNWTSAITIAVWIRLDNLLGSQYAIGRDDVAFERNWYVRWNNINSWEWRIFTTGGNRTLFGQVGTAGELALWGGSWRSSDGRVEHWKNGKSVNFGTHDVGGTIVGSTIIGIRLGLAASGGSDVDNGEIHTALVFSRVLTPTEWTNLFVDGRDNLYLSSRDDDLGAIDPRRIS